MNFEPHLSMQPRRTYDRRTDARPRLSSVVVDREAAEEGEALGDVPMESTAAPGASADRPQENRRLVRRRVPRNQAGAMTSTSPPRSADEGRDRPWEGGKRRPDAHGDLAIAPAEVLARSGGSSVRWSRSSGRQRRRSGTHDSRRPCAGNLFEEPKKKKKKEKEKGKKGLG